MFKALRDYFSRPEQEAPKRGRGRRLAGLFAFEFVVVLLGVLAAQLLQDWFAERRDARRAAAFVAELGEETARFVTSAEYRLRAHDCETARLARLAELIRTGQPADEAERAAPLMPMPVITGWSDETRQIVARHSGAEAIARFDALRLLAQMISERQRRLEDQWADFRLLAPEARGMGDSRDLALAAARSSGLLAAIDMNAQILVQRYGAEFEADRDRLAQLAAMDHPCAAVALRPVVSEPPPARN